MRFASSATTAAGTATARTGPDRGSRRDDEDDLAALIEALGLAPAHLVGNSFGASVALGLGARRPELVRSLSGHEPPVIALAGDDSAVRALGDGVRTVVVLIDSSEQEAAARLFAGPRAWDLMPPEDRARMIANAGTLADEHPDPRGRPSPRSRRSRAPSC